MVSGIFVKGPEIKYKGTGFAGKGARTNIQLTCSIEQYHLVYMLQKREKKKAILAGPE